MKHGPEPDLYPQSNCTRSCYSSTFTKGPEALNLKEILIWEAELRRLDRKTKSLFVINSWPKTSFIASLMRIRFSGGKESCDQDWCCEAHLNVLGQECSALRDKDQIIESFLGETDAALTLSNLLSNKYSTNGRLKWCHWEKNTIYIFKLHMN